MKNKKTTIASRAGRLAMLLLLPVAANAQLNWQPALITEAAPQPSGLFELPLVGRLDRVGLRVADSRKNFSNLSQESVILEFATPWAWTPGHRTTLALRFALNAGRFTGQMDERAFGSFGPVLRITRADWHPRFYVDIGLNPTIIDGTQYRDGKLGTSFNFTSHVGIGLKLGPAARHELKLRYQHISNGGLDDVNPGVDMVGIDYAVRFGKR